MKNKANVEEKEKEDKDKKEGTDTCISMLPGLFTLLNFLYFLQIFMSKSIMSLTTCWS